jgi:hypothetical protein
MVLGISTSAFANGDHSGDMLRVIGHMLAEPDHLAMLSLVVVSVLFVIRKLRSRA